MKTKLTFTLFLLCTAYLGFSQTTATISGNNSAVHNLKAFPNPFLTISSVQFDLQSNGLVKMELYNTKGTKFYETTEVQMGAGQRSIAIPGDNLTDGIYLCKIYVNGLPSAAEYMVKASNK